MFGSSSRFAVGLSRVWLSLGLVFALTASLLLGLPSPAGAVAGYGDVSEGTWYTHAVQWSTDNNITGLAGPCFVPDAPVSRGETAVWIYNMENRPDAGDPHSFTDVTDASQDDAVSWMSNNEITTGTSDTTFAPDETLTRAQAATFLHRLAGEPVAPPHDFADVPEGWRDAGVSWMAHRGITTGTSATTFAPDETLTRAQLVTFLYRSKNEPDVTINTSTPDCDPTSDTAENPTDSPEDPTDTPEDPTDTPEDPTDTPEDPTDTPEDPTDTPEDPTDTPTLAPEPAISISDTHGCKLSADGQLACWGDNTHGQANPPPGTYTDIAVSRNYSCAIRSDGRVACWGEERNYSCAIRSEGQVECLGDDPPAGAFTAVTANPFHPCGIRVDGTIDCWGDSETQYPGGGSTDRPPSGTYTDISLGEVVGCGIRTDQSIQCWGWTSGSLGIGPSPQGTFTSVDVRRRTACALRTDSTITCWGKHYVPLPDAPAGSFIDISVTRGDFDTYSCALRTDLTITCWGEDSLTLPYRPGEQPTTIIGLTSPPTGRYLAIDLTAYQGCALRSDYTHTCWGGPAPSDSDTVDDDENQDNLDDCCPRILVSPTALTIPEGSSRSYSIVLEARPEKDVNVFLAGWDFRDIRVDPFGPVASYGALTFTPSNWSIPQRITVTALRDQDGDSIDRTAVVTNTGPLRPDGNSVEVRITISDSPSGHYLCKRTYAVLEPPSQPEDVRIESEDSGIRVHWRIPREGTCARAFELDLNPFYLEFPDIGGLTDRATYLEFRKRLTITGTNNAYGHNLNHDGSGEYSYFITDGQLSLSYVPDAHEVRVIASNESGFSISDPAVVPEARFAARRAEFRDVRMAIESLVSTHGSNVSWLDEVWSYVLNLERGSHPAAGRFMPFVFVTDRDTGPLASGLVLLRESCSDLRPDSCDVIGEGISVEHNYAGLIAHELGHIYTLSTGASSNPLALEAGFLYLAEKQRSDPSWTPDPSWGGLCNVGELFADVAAYLVLLEAEQSRVSALTYWVGCTDHDLPPDEALTVLTEALGGYTPAAPQIFDAVSAGNSHSCGLKIDGTITCSGGLDAPSGAFSAVSVGRASCGLKIDGTITCWGNNFFGQADAPSGAFSAVSTSNFHSCGLKIDGTITCWGSNDEGQADAPSGAFSAVSAGALHSCGLKIDGTITCWGSNGEGEADAPSGAFSAVSAGAYYSCGLKIDGTITCWGNNFLGQVDAPSGAFSAVSAGGGHSCGLKIDGTITCWGKNNSGQADAPSGAFSAVSAGDNHSCGLKIDGTITCWGTNVSGQTAPPLGAG